MEYTNDQILALSAMSAWFQKPDDLFLTLNGAAGTGKTTIMKEFINNTNISRSRIAVSAPTHKAKKVIQQATDFTSHTIQSLLGLRPDIGMENFNPNLPVFKPIADEQLANYKIVIIDESSMINKEAFKYIVDTANRHNTKVLFLGDAFQLPPIKETISKVFTGVENVISLKEVVRQKNTNPMYNVLKMLREDVKNNTSNGVKYLTDTEEHIIGDQGFRCLQNVKKDNTSFGFELLQYFLNTEYNYNKDFIKFITYTNNDVAIWSEALRQQLLKDDANNLINTNELLMGYKTIMDRRGNLILQNSEDYIVDSLAYGESEEGIKGYFTILLTELGSKKTIFIVDTNDKENEEIFKSQLHSILEEAKVNRSLWTKYYNFKNKHIVIKDLYHYGKLLCGKDLYYANAITTHKSQGSTYSNTGINLKNLFRAPNVYERNRLIYVALSRAKNVNLILV